MNRYRRLNISDLDSIQSFKRWLKDNLPTLYNNKGILNEHVEIYLDYIKENIKGESPDNMKIWGDKIRKLKSDLEKLESSESRQ